MAENAYLRSLREQYAAHEKSIAGLEQRATEAKRDLTTDEMRSIIEMGEKNKALYTQIEDLSEIELRNAKVAAMADRVNSAIAAGRASGGAGDGDADDDDADDGTPQTRAARLGGARTQDRDPGFYVRGGQHSFLADQYRSGTMNDQDAKERLERHSRALRDNVHLRDVLGAGASTGGLGLVPPVWLAEQFAPILHRRLRVATLLRQVPWAGPFAWSIPIAGTPAVGTGVAEGINSTETDPTYTVLTVTPQAIMGYSEVSRQMLEAANPAVDAVIWGDLMGDFYDRTEAYVITALNGQSGVNTVTVSAGAVTTTDIAAQRAGVLDGISAISDNSAGDADVFVGRTARWTTFLKMADGQGRPLILSQQYNPQNAIGTGGNTQGFRSPVQGNLENLVVVTSPTVAASTGFIINSQEILFSVSPPMQFQFEQPAGPALVRVGIWGYEAVVTGRRPKAITKISYSGS
jgi:HK97 family phage major capsid protein